MSELNMSSDLMLKGLINHMVQPAPDRLPAAIRQVQTDSRQVQSGDLFVCLRGERFDAHDFASDVVSKGASVLVVERLLDLPVPQLLVRDSRMALGGLAWAWRNQFRPMVFGVVGSNGKTTSKEMLASICRKYFGEEATLVTQGNLNNDVGVPQTLFRLRAHHTAAVIEMGMNHPGEIGHLASLVQPNVVLLTNAQREHQEFMKSVEAVAAENGSAFLHLQSPGTAIFPVGTPHDVTWMAQAGDQRCVRFGMGGDFEPSFSGASGELQIETVRGALRVKPAFLGQHNAMNAAGAAAAAWAGGCADDSIQAGLEMFQPVSGRLQVVLRNRHVLLINDSYNANPDSVNAASAVLAEQGGNTLLVLGDMGEVGNASDAYHQEVGRVAKQLGVSKLYALGEATRHSVGSFGEGAQHFESLDQLIKTIIQCVQPGHWTVLVKGSRFMKMERVVDALKQHFEPGQGDQHVA
ncbi:UDP-N-acetylmuramoyl-tripeptide--D-alanyl-D-alanine ligase [Limnobacter humi]|uniref:UDP-N-acetylmuramoyl-tripeptide--D-alanyl-D-alanine ligase n=1 Tax=Limnobacter humi TaxID=1778671 RepID=A0ABT1WHS7_9BURK|nr:UDP-N-acetylmuramoyl-tripeptide--D-alanyl-D-alanine ligase [Limnobacter humi]MCQ8897077.1 UDP-N-acetylmuramoyl-tripeptide--D-alanyl-D-alanine ligase [Limnobacter humi]